MIKNFSSFNSDPLNESILYFSPKMRNHLQYSDNWIAKKMIEMEGEDIKGMDATFIDVDGEGDVTFITMANAIKILKDRYPDVNLDTISDKDFADYIWDEDMDHSEFGVYKKSRNSIKIGKLANRLFKGTLKPTELEKFVNDFKATITNDKEEILLVKGEEIRHWYNEKNYFQKTGSLGNSCMANKDGSFFNIYVENPDVCQLLILKVGDKIVARGLVWKLDSIKGLGGSSGVNFNFQYFLDRVYSCEDYQIEKVRKWAIEKGWAVKYGSNYLALWDGKKHEVSMSVKIKKSTYGGVYPYMDTFCRWDYRRGFLWNDQDSRRGRILKSLSGSYDPETSMGRVFINRFLDLFD